MEKLKFKAFKGLFGMFVFFGILKNAIICSCQNKKIFFKKNL